MIQVTAVSILAMTITLSLGRPGVWRFKIDHASAAILGALLSVTLGVVSIQAMMDALVFLLHPVITIVSLMTITIIAEQAGLFDFLAQRIAGAAKGNAKRLFLYIFLAGSLTGTIFTNDAAVLIFTPLVFTLIKDAGRGSWDESNKVPFYFAVLYVANVAGALIISNPINIVASEFFDVEFLEYAAAMMIPAVVSIIVSYIGIRIAFRRSIPETFKPIDHGAFPPKQVKAMQVCAVVLFLTLVAFFTEPFTGIPTWMIALFSALVLLALHKMINGTPYASVARGIGWDVIIFVIGIFVIARGIERSGLTAGIGTWLMDMSGGKLTGMTHATSFAAAVLSAMINNHPTAYIMPMVIQDMNLPVFDSKMLMYSALIGGDLGPKMLPIGSLAALIWFRILRDRGVDIPYRLYIKIGIPVTLAAIFFAVLTLNLEIMVMAP